jgi:hypothetical protein
MNALLLDATVLAHTSMLDLRIAGPDHRQIPYLVEKLDGPLSINLPPLERTPNPASRAGNNKTASGSLSYYRLRLPEANLPVSRLVLTTSARVFQREAGILIEKNPGNERQEPWTYRVVSTAWSHTDPNTPAPPLLLRLPSLESSEARLVMNEGDNGPLPLEPVSLLLPSYRLRFFRQSDADLTLYYGCANIEAPRYDLALLAPQLVGTPAEEISLQQGSGSVVGEARSFSMQTTVFWLVLALAVIVLFLLIARLVKKGAAE